MGALSHVCWAADAAGYGVCRGGEYCENVDLVSKDFLDKGLTL
jgi:hypothetical protein